MSNQTELDVGSWRQLFMKEPQGIFIIVDPQIRESRGQLRSLTLLHELGLNRTTFTTSWDTIRFVSYEHCVVHENTKVDELADAFPIAQLVSQEIEELSPSNATKKLLLAHQRPYESGALLVFVIESESFMLRNSTRSKSFIDEYELQKVYSYGALFKRYCEIAGLPTPKLGMHQSLNLRLHRLAWELQKDSFRRLADLFEYSSIPPGSWAWDLLETLAASSEIRHDDRGLSRVLRPWIDNDISWTVNRLLETIQQFNYDPKLIRLHREQLGMKLR